MDIKEIYKRFKECGTVSTDTRKIDKDVMFFALKGANFNGNEFASQALAMGAKYVVIDEEKYKADDRYILVKDVLEALQNLAHFHRKQFNIPFIAITGSNGKTTTKELVNAVLSKKYKTYATKGNLNNHIGIPLTLLAIQEDVEMAVIEMGANHQKEIEGYCKYTEPTHGLITNIGKAHLEGFGGIEGVKKGKGELYDYLLANKGVAFINSTHEVLTEISAFPDPVLYAAKNNFSYNELVESNPFVKYKSEEGQIIETHLTGEYNFDNISAALCVGKYFQVLSKDANAAVAAYDPQNNRSQFVKKASNTVLLDAYNANPSSMKAAIENFASLQVKGKILILGDMFELGEESIGEHKAIGKLIASLKFDQVFLCGKNMKYASEEIKNAYYFESKKELELYLKNNKLEDSTILLKGSRGMGLEDLMVLL